MKVLLPKNMDPSAPSKDRTDIRRLETFYFSIQQRTHIWDRISFPDAQMSQKIKTCPNVDSAIHNRDEVHTHRGGIMEVSSIIPRCSGLSRDVVGIRAW
jgi:hypothetical protein